MLLTYGVVVGCSAPFTIQRLAELVMYPSKHYKKASKWLRGLEKVKTMFLFSIESVCMEGEIDRRFFASM